MLIVAHCLINLIFSSVHVQIDTTTARHACTQSAPPLPPMLLPPPRYRTGIIQTHPSSTSCSPLSPFNHHLPRAISSSSWIISTTNYIILQIKTVRKNVHWLQATFGNNAHLMWHSLNFHSFRSFFMVEKKNKQPFLISDNEDDVFDNKDCAAMQCVLFIFRIHVCLRTFKIKDN